MLSLFLAYSNPGFDTIEGEVFKACVAAGAISEDNSVNPQKVSF